MTTLFLTWQDPDSRRWYPIGRLDTEGQGDARTYRFVYTEGARRAADEAGLHPLVSFPDLDRAYTDTEIFPLFANRVMPRSRPDFPDFVEWMSMAHDERDPIAILARSGGRRATDTLEVFPAPEPDAEGWHRFLFFVHGLRHQTDAAQERVATLDPGERLLIQADIQNPRDRHALTVRTDEQFAGDMHTVGYLPRYLAHDIAPFLLDRPEDVIIEVERVNESPAPANFRLLCRLRARWPEGQPPFSGQDYQPLSSVGAAHPVASS